MSRNNMQEDTPAAVHLSEYNSLVIIYRRRITRAHIGNKIYLSETHGDLGNKLIYYKIIMLQF